MGRIEKRVCIVVLAAFLLALGAMLLQILLSGDSPTIYHITILLDGSDEAYWQNFRLGADRAARDRNADVRYVTRYEGAAAAAQVESLRQAWEGETDGVVLFPLDRGLLEAALEDAPAGLAVTAVGAPLESGRVDCVISADPEEMGRRLADALAADGRTAVTLYRSAQETETLALRRQGFLRRLEELVMVHGFAPGAALAEIRNNGEVYATEICENTLYNYIYRGDVFLHLTPEHLHNKGRRHYAAKSKKQAARSSHGKSIENRPQEVKGRGSFGHWEMDSVMGCKGSKKALLVLTERRTRMGIIILLEDHTAASVVKAINGLERRFGKLFYKLFKSITVDNGCEFQDFEGIEAAHRRKGKRTIVFFCHPYSAFERGSNENMNRLIRRFFPKGTSFDNVKPEEVRAAERWVNNYPRKLLGWKSAAMLFEQELLTA